MTLRWNPAGVESWAARQPRRAVALAGLFVVVLNVPGLRNLSGYPLRDDPDTPQILAAVRRDMSPAGLAGWFARDWPFGNRFYRPLVAVSYAADSAVYGDWAPGYRLTNWLLALVTALAVTAWIGAWSRSLAAGMCAGAVFSLRQVGSIGPLGPDVVVVAAAVLGAWYAVMRLQGIARPLRELHWLPALVVAFGAEWYRSDSVLTWIAARTAILGCLFAIGAAACCARYANTGRAGPFAAMLVLAAAGLASYEQAVMVVAAPIALLCVQRGEGARRLWRAFLALLCLAALYLLLRAAVVGTQPSTYQLIQLKSTPQGALLEALRYLVPITPLAADAHTRLTTSGLLASLDVLFWYDLALVAAWLAAYAFALRRAPQHMAGLLVAKAAFLAPVCGLHVFPHYYYLPEAATAGVTACLLLPAAFRRDRPAATSGSEREVNPCVTVCGPP